MLRKDWARFTHQIAQGDVVESRLDETCSTPRDSRVRTLLSFPRHELMNGTAQDFDDSFGYQGVGVGARMAINEARGLATPDAVFANEVGR